MGKIIVTTLASLIIFLNFNGPVRAEVFNLFLYKEENGAIRLDRKTTNPLYLIGMGRPTNIAGNYKARIASFNDIVLAQIEFKPVLMMSIDRYNPAIEQYEGETIQEEEGAFPFVLQLPYYPNAQYAEIFDPDGEKQLKIYLTAFARCNENKICETGETEQECPSDCRPKPPLTTFDKFWRLGLTFVYWLALLGFITLIIFLAIKKIRKKKSV